MRPQGVRFFDESLQQSFNRGHIEGRAADVLMCSTFSMHADLLSLMPNASASSIAKISKF